MEMIQKKSNMKAKIFFVIAFIVTSLSFYYGMLNLFGTIIDEFNSLTLLLPMMIACDLPVAYLYFFFNHTYLKPVTKKNIIWFISITSILIVGAIVLFLLNTHYYFFNNNTKISLFVFLVAVVVMLIINSFLLFCVTNKNFIQKYEVKLVDNKYTLKSKHKKILLGIYSLFALYFTGNFSVSIFRFGNYVIEPLLYVFLLLVILLPGATLFLKVSKRENKFSKIYYYVTAALSLLSIVGIFCVLYFDFASMLNVGQTIFSIDFACSIPIGPIVLSLLLLYNLF